MTVVVYMEILKLFLTIVQNKYMLKKHSEFFYYFKIFCKEKYHM